MKASLAPDRRRGGWFLSTARPGYNRVMTHARRLRPAFLGLLLAAAPPAVDTVPRDASFPAIRETQVTLMTGHTRFRGTVVGKDGSTLTLLTSAHCLSPEDVGTTIGVQQGGGNLRARVGAVARNPAFHPIRSRDRRDPSVRGVLGVDNAIVTLLVGPSGAPEERLLAGFRPAEMAARVTPGGRGQVVTVRVIDQTGVEHVVRAGNHLNPKSLAWGHSVYRVTPGDSGSGVFLVREDTRGATRPILVGNVSLSDDRGGVASLVSRADRWVDQALRRPEPGGSE